MSLRHLGHTWRDVDSFLTSIGGTTIKTCHKLTNILVNKDFDEFITDERGGKIECSKTEATFTAETLARFIDQRFYELNSPKKIDQQLWRIPTTAPTILLCHDESTYKCVEITAKRWIMPDNAPFYNKGKGRSIMYSDLLVMHQSGPFFSLTEKEYSEALKTYPNLNDDCDINYEKNSASAAIALGGDNYFNNQSVLNQFKRLFQLLPFKKEYKNHNFLCLVDNSRTHTATETHLNDFGMRPGPGVLLIRSIILMNTVKNKLSDVMMMMDTVKVSKLEKLAAEYNIKIIFTLKYHCETNRIEGYWCHLKQYIRKHTDQSFEKLTTLMPEAKANFIQKLIHLKRFRRFWRTIKAYDQGKDYLEVLRMVFSGL
ncbi:unnamed protein product, partial [Rotaria magnacalcarata]